MTEPEPAPITLDRLREFIVDELGWLGEPLTDDYPLLENRVLDSLGLFRMVGFIEEECGVRIDDDQVVPANFVTLTSIADMAKRAK